MVIVPATHVPVPLHVDAARAVPLLQLAPAQMTPAEYLRHAPAPLHTPSLPQLLGPWSAHPPLGSLVPDATARQRPACPLRRQEKQVDVQAFSQQTPSAQKFDAHSPAPPQACPRGFLPHDPFTHTLGVTQSALLAHEFAQLEPRHLNGAHEVGAGGTHRPDWQVLAWVKRSVAGSQLAPRQAVPEA